MLEREIKRERDKEGAGSTKAKVCPWRERMRND
jgi:hypothetical protein